MNALGSAFGHQVIALNGDFGAASAIQSGIRAESIQPPARDTSPYFWTLARLIDKHRPALVCTYNWGTIEATLGARLTRHCPVIHNECGFGPDEAVARKTHRSWTRRLILNTIYRTVVTSRNLQRIAQNEFGLPSAKVQLIPTGVDAERYRPWRNQPGRRALAIADDTTLFGFVGSLRPEKNLPLLLRAFASANIGNSKLMLVGEGALRLELEALAGELGIAEHVVFAGHAANPAEYLAMFDVFTLSSVTEQVSNAVLEAMASGLPIVCTNVGDNADLLGEPGQALCVPSGDIPAFARRMHDLAANPDLRAKLGRANRQRCLEHYSSQSMVRAYGELYQAAIAQTSGPAR